MRPLPTSSRHRLARGLLPLSLSLAVVSNLFTGAGCSRTSRVDAGTAAGILHAAISAEPQTLDPHLALAYTDMQVILALFEGLTAVDEATSRTVPAAAERWSVSDDGLQWTFHLRPDLRWSDGTPLDALTFRDSLARALAPTIASEYAYLLFPIRNAARFNAGELPDFVAVGVRVVDPVTLLFTLEQPTPHFPALLAQPVAYPVPLHVLRKNGGTINRANRWTQPATIVGNGPFRLTDWQPNRHLTVDRNPQFRAAGEVALNGLMFYPYENAASQEAAFRSGQLHLTSELPLTKIAPYRRDQPAALRLDPFLQTAFVRFNTTRPPLDDPRVRQALALALDRDALARHVLSGGQQPAASLTPNPLGDYTPPAGASHDPERARALLASAGFPGGQGLRPLEVISRPREIDRQILEAMQQMWREELGVTVTLAIKEQRVWLDDEIGLRYDLSNAAWIGDFLDPITFLGCFTSDSGNNRTGWKNARYDGLIADAQRAADADARHAAYAAAEALLLAEAPLTPLYYGTQPFLIRPEVQGWPPAVLGFRRYQTVRLAAIETP